MAALTGGGMVDVAKLPLPAFRSSYGPSSGWLLFVLPMYITYGAMSVGMQTIRTMVPPLDLPTSPYISPYLRTMVPPPRRPRLPARSAHPTHCC